MEFAGFPVLPLTAGKRKDYLEELWEAFISVNPDNKKSLADFAKKYGPLPVGGDYSDPQKTVAEMLVEKFKERQKDLIEIFTAVADGQEMPEEPWERMCQHLYDNLRITYTYESMQGKTNQTGCIYSKITALGTMTSVYLSLMNWIVSIVNQDQSIEIAAMNFENCSNCGRLFWLGNKRKDSTTCTRECAKEYDRRKRVSNYKSKKKA